MKALRATYCAALLAASATAGVFAPAQGRAQGYPSGPVRLIVAYSAGGTGDFIGRLLAGKLQEALGQPVVVENRPGASGAIGAQNVISAAPDGLTLLVGQTGEISINQHWIKNAGYDPDRDLMPIALGGVVPLALVVPNNTPYSTADELAKFLASSKKPMTFASAGNGTPGFFAGEVLKLKTKSNLTHVPYKGAGPALNDILGGHVDLYFSGFPAVVSHRQGKTLKLLAISAAKRSANAPDIPTVAETIGDKDFDFTLWVGFFAPRGTPAEIVDRLNREVNAVLALPDVKTKMAEAGADIERMSAGDFAAFVKAESVKYQRVIKDAGLTPE